MRWVADKLGHADPALTLRTYAHATQAEDRDVAFADFGAPERPQTAPASELDEAISQVVDFGGPSGTRTLDPRVKSPTKG